MFLLVWVLQMNWRSHFYSHDLVQKGLIISGRIFQYFHWNKWDGDILLTHHRFVEGSSLQSERWQRDGWNRLLQVLQSDCIICSLPRIPRCCFLFQAKVYRYFISLTRVRKRIWGGIICGNVYLCCSWPHAFIVAERKKEYFIRFLWKMPQYGIFSVTGAGKVRRKGSSGVLFLILHTCLPCHVRHSRA